ncbi:hypothetical protein ATANTOWER_030946 [Ataeniobius toweri]|uniref:Uncharacterized protein n=1 Tax=Ataeniobius toweri TaxID=208326 RepID=A0ABU7BI94_9TELE|nr:hypothetical protein [Ataeniobius toweri]
MSFCQQRDISALPLLSWSRRGAVEEMGPLERWGFYTASGIMGNPLLQFAWLWLNAVYFESSRKVCTGLSRCNHGCGPNSVSVIYAASATRCRISGRRQYNDNVGYSLAVGNTSAGYKYSNNT